METGSQVQRKTALERVLYQTNAILFHAIRILAGGMFALCILINFANVVGRYAFGKPIYWAEEITIFLIMWCVMLGASLVAAGEDHLKVEILEVSLKPWAVRVCHLGIAVATLAISLLVVFCGYQLVAKLFVMHQLSVVAQVPMSIVFSSLPVGFGLMSLVAICRIYELALKKPGALLKSWR